MVGIGVMWLRLIVMIELIVLISDMLFVLFLYVVCEFIWMLLMFGVSFMRYGSFVFFFI